MGTGNVLFGAPAYEDAFVRIRMQKDPSCNLACSYCPGESRCLNYIRPGRDCTVLSTQEALLTAYLARSSGNCDIGLSVPGDSLAHETTFETLRALHDRLPEISPCISTNGVLLEDKLDELGRVGVRALSVTINATRAETAERIYNSLSNGGQVLTGRSAAEVIVQSQWAGVIMAAKSGFRVKVNTILIPGVNEDEVRHIAHRTEMLNVSEHRVIRATGDKWIRC